MKALTGRLPRLSRLQLGALLLSVAALVGVLLFNKSALAVRLASGDTLLIEAERDYRLRDNQSRVKVAGVPVGVVTGVEKAGENALLTVKLDKGTLAKLGTSPSAAIRPTTLLGGNYYVALSPGGDPGKPVGRVPAARTTVPVELDRVLEQIGPEQRDGLRTSITQLEGATQPRGAAAAQALVERAPDTLQPAGQVLQALRGSEPEDDLSSLVQGLEDTGRALSAEQGELDGMLRAGAGATGVLNGQREAIARTIVAAPRTLEVTRAALTRLDRTLTKVQDTAPRLQATMREGAQLLRAARPVLAEARPVVADVRLLARDLRPMLVDAVPVVRQAEQVTEDVRGPVVDRLRGPVLKAVLSPYRGKTPLYQELGYMFAGLAATAKMTDANGATLAFHPGPGTESVGGVPPLPVDALFADLLGLEGTTP
ncbi:MAG: mammalian cell entry protein [Frankiales bacterium]|jgi:phospholipid/cholesterol/gamma-HCH transport system substrate-binding protein|nr:mammalian cell entry protein [Frankiales bacterium]